MSEGYEHPIFLAFGHYLLTTLGINGRDVKLWNSPHPLFIHLNDIKMNRLMIGVLVSILLLAGSCASIYTSTDARTLAMRHEKIAVIPPKVSIAARKKVDVEALKEQQRTESLTFQREIHAWLLKRKVQNRIRVEIQDVGSTNALLARANYFNDDRMSPNELCRLLGVDAVLTSNFGLSRPMSEGAAIALGLVFGIWGATNNVAVGMEIYDGGAEKLLWSYNHTLSGSIGTTPTSLVRNLMRNASRKMPHIMERP